MSVEDENRRRSLAQARVHGLATHHARKEYGWGRGNVFIQIVEQLDDETFHLRLTGIGLDGNQVGKAVDLKVSEKGTIEELPH